MANGTDDEDDKEGKIKKSLQNVSKELKIDLDDIVSTIYKMDKGAREVAKSFGQGSEFLQAYKESLGDALGPIERLGGNWNSILEMQKAYSGILNRNTILSTELFDDFYAITQVTDQSMTEITRSFKDIGANAYQAAEGMKDIVDVSRSLGVSAEKVSSQVLNNMSAMNKFTFQGGVEGMAKMAAQAVSLRFNMDETLKVADKVFDPEGAIEMAASLQRLGVAQGDLLDPLRLMDLAQNDPAELQNQIVKLSEQFVHLNAAGQFEILPDAKRRLIEIEGALGMSRGELSKMALGAAETSAKMKEIRFSDAAVTDEQRQMIANMAEIGKSGKYEVSFTDKEGKAVTKQVSQLDKEDIKAIAEAGKPKSLEEIAKEQLDINKQMLAAFRGITEPIKAGIGTSQTAGKLVNVVETTSKTISTLGTTESLGTKNVRQLTDDTIGETIKKISELTNGDISLSSFVQSLGKVETKLQNWGNMFGEESKTNIKKVLSDLDSNSNEFIRIITGLVKKVAGMELGVKPTGSNVNEESRPTSFNVTPTLQNTGQAQSTIKPQELKVEVIPQETASVTKENLFPMNNMTPNNMGETKTMSESKIDFNLNITSNNPNIDTNQLLVFMEKQEFKQKMINSIKDSIMNGKTGQIGNTLVV